MPPVPPSVQTTPRGWADLAAVFLLGLFWWQAVSASVQWSQTSDELPHLTAGYTYDKFGDFRLHYENGNLPQRVHGLAPLALGAKFPTDEARWRASDCWQLGWDFLNSEGNPTDRMLLGARGLNAFFGVGLGVFVYLLARRWYGPHGGLVALGFYAFCPNFLAHSALATSDLAAALCLTLAPWFYWRHLGRRDYGSGVLAGLFTGLALVAKFNGVLLVPVYAVLSVWDAWGRRGPATFLARLGRNLALALLPAGVGLLVIWAFYGFRYDMRSPSAPELERFGSAWPENLGFTGTLLDTARDWRILPQAWLHGLANVLAGAVGRPAFFAGEYSLFGWWQFFPTLFLVKTPLAMLAGVGLAGGFAAAQLRRAGTEARNVALLAWAPLIVLTAIVALTAVTSHLNIGHRHILAVYPLLFILLGRLALLPGRWRILALVLLAAQATESLRIRPHYLAHFNAIGGGASQAHRLVTDSSLDWGQALPTLREWLAAHRRPDEPVYLSYFGSAWAPHYGVRPTHFLPAVNIARPALTPYEYRPGLYCISATSLSEVYSRFRGPWRPEWENLFRSASLPEDYTRFDDLRFARLCKYLQQRQPDAEAGYAILIYRLDQAEIDAALRGPVTGW